MRELVGQLGSGVQLVGRGVAGRIAHALERQHHGAQLRQAVGQHVAVQPAAEVAVFFAGGTQKFQCFGLGVRGRQVEFRLLEVGRHAVELGLGDGVWAAFVFHDGTVFLFHLVNVALAFALHQNLDARLPQVVAAAIAVVDANHRFQVIHDLVPRQELAQHGADHRRAAHAAAHAHLEADFARFILHQLQAGVVPTERGAVFLGAVERQLELARQEGEFGVQRAPLAQDFRVGARIDDFVGGNTGQRIGGDVANAVAAGLDAVQLHRRQQVHHVRALVERNPVVLHVGARGEVAVAILELRADAATVCQRDVAQLFLRGLRFGQQRGVGLIVFTRHLGQHAQLGARQFAIRHGHAQHRGVALDIPAVLQAQGLELVVRELAVLEAFQLIAVLLGTQVDELFVEFCVLIHGRRLT
ncbi:hypothetical protein SDC9_122398 [bioreactor metagenome]|uniref:Uncharacterized protein n=1 Tax=bioreactor metagenome TaxID=1076179 RepID=A0A645CES5_9ZZZZ